MEVITIKNHALSKLINNLEKLTREIRIQNKLIQDKKELSQEELLIGDRWLDNEQACKILKVTKRTLQIYRDHLLISYSQIGRKVYYKASDIQATLESHYISVNPP